MRKIYICAAAAVVTGASAIDAATADEVFAHGCYMMLENPPMYQEMTFARGEDGSLWLHSRFSDGGSSSVALDYRRDMYWKQDSPTLDHYFIDGAGYIHLIDDMGEIGIAKRLPKNSTSGDCVP